ncbi:MAG: hypothetical protein RR327_01055 [Clostridia bacterium]
MITKTKKIISIALLFMLILSILLTINTQSEVFANEKTDVLNVAFIELDGFFEYDKNGIMVGYGVDYFN